MNIDDLKVPPVVGEMYSVPCIKVPVRDGKRFIIVNMPVINLLHTDKENGQEQPHYHIDSRFLPDKRETIHFPIRIYPHEIP